jgi:hypothetical protein
MVYRQAKRVLLIHSFCSLATYFDAHFHLQENIYEKKESSSCLATSSLLTTNLRTSRTLTFFPFFLILLDDVTLVHTYVTIEEYDYVLIEGASDTKYLTTSCQHNYDKYLFTLERVIRE